MSKLTQGWLDFLREQHPIGSRVQAKEMADPQSHIRPGATGKLLEIEDDGAFVVAWDRGGVSAVTIGKDRFTLLQPEPTTLKLYMPLTADLYAYDEWGDLEPESEELNGTGLLPYEAQIVSALVKYRDPAEAERGIMNWYDTQDSVNAKVRSAVFTAEIRDHALWGVTECRVVGDLTPDELSTLKDYITGQAADGWGEGFEQRELRNEDSELYVHLWSFGDWEIKTEQEQFGPKVAEGLPEACYSVLHSTGELIILKRGESGYYRVDFSSPDKEANMELADHYNEKLGITSEQRQAMEVGSMVGWTVPGADPQNYVCDEPQMGGMTLG